MERKPMDADVIVIGGGLAGITAARAACEQGAQVLLLTRITVGFATNSALSNGVFAGPTRSYGPDEYVRDTLSIGKGLNSLPHLQAAAREIGPAMKSLQASGCRVSEAHGHYMITPSRPDLIPGVTLMKTIAAGLKEMSGLTVRAGFHALDILRHEGRACGVAGVDKTGRGFRLYAPAVILACGGAGAVYLRNDNQKRALGQGYAMALRAGLELRDMEFVQFYPFAQAEPGIPTMLLYPPMPKNARLIDGAGQDVAARHGLGNLNEMILKKRDDLSALLCEVMRAGPIYMDYRDVPPADWSHPPLAMLAKLKFDFKRKPFAVAPAVHFFMGGLRTGPQTDTQLPGLYACGEVAWGLHGANRRGGNALSECLVFGQIAGAQAALWAKSRHAIAPAGGAPDPPTSVKPAFTALRRFGRRIREIAWNHAGVVRTEDGLRKGLSLLRDAETELRGAAPGSPAEFVKKSDLLGACLVLRAIFGASLERQESLGSFKRSDFPDEPAHSGFGNSCIRYDAANDRFSVTFARQPAS
jgi:succinate dehydrogenase/fumarate reductase flavoprotein subunit